MLEIYNNIRERRKQLGLTQQELATKVGYTDRSTIAKIEAGKIDIPQSTIVALAKALECSPGDLMGIHEERIEFNLPNLVNAVDKLGNARRLTAYVEAYAKLNDLNKSIVDNLTNSLLESQGAERDED
jgi:transcriptional regulator with XRE-family HTH domain